MKNTVLYGFYLFFALIVFNACDDLVSVRLENDSPVEKDAGGIYILCDGIFSLNNSTLALYDFQSSSLITDYFQMKNKRKLGDTGNDIQQYGSKLYVVVNVSSQIEVLDARTGVGVKQIPLFDGTIARQPRCITFWENKAYVCSFDGTVSKIDTASLQVESSVSVGRNPDGIAVSNGKLYVSNSGGLDYANPLGFDNTVSVIDIATFTNTGIIPVGLNPGKIKADLYGNVYVASRGDHKTIGGVWQCIDTRTDQVVGTYNLSVTNFDISGNLAYLYSYDNTTKESWIKVFDLKSKQIVDNSFIKDGTEIKTPYGININPYNGDVYITDAGNYATSGDVYCFHPNGLLNYRIANVGINPNSVLYVEEVPDQTGSDVDTTDLEDRFIYEVLDYSPAPGQFIGKLPVYNAGDTKETMRLKAEQMLKGRTDGMVSLGRYGGSLTFAFRQAVRNTNEGYDFRILGNAFTNSSEPGIVEVSVDENGNGEADDAWYELAGSDYSKTSTIKGYSICYYHPSSLSDSVFYRDNKGKTGYVNAYYPAWKGDSIVCTGTLLAPTATQNANGFWMLNMLDWGYADNAYKTSDLSCFDIDWAVNASGQSIHLDQIHFIRVYTGVNQNAGNIGELSTEITGAENLHP